MVKIHSMRLDNEPFLHIASGKKDIEMRLFDEKRRAISPGDEIELENRENGAKMRVKVKKMHVFSDFRALYLAFDKLRIGYSEDENADFRDMEQYYFKDDIEKYSVVGIEIELVE